MIQPLAPAPGFVIHGPEIPTTPVVLAVPHAGRDYPPELRDDAAVPVQRLRQLEDRHADLLIADAIAAGVTAIVATRARAWLDLNRDPREMDPGMIEGPPPPHLAPTARTRGGLGLVPRRVGGTIELWRRKLDAAEVEARVQGHHVPYHAALARALDAARARHGRALLLDCHSMPPLRAGPDGGCADLVLGDRHGRSAAPALLDRIESIATEMGWRVARNAPYAGGYALDLHGDPDAGIDAVQIEIDRSRYLDAALDRPGPGLQVAQMLVARLFTALSADPLSGHPPRPLLAAE